MTRAVPTTHAARTTMTHAAQVDGCARRSSVAFADPVRHGVDRRGESQSGNVLHPPPGRRSDEELDVADRPQSSDETGRIGEEHLGIVLVGASRKAGVTMGGADARSRSGRPSPRSRRRRSL